MQLQTNKHVEPNVSQVQKKTGSTKSLTTLTSLACHGYCKWPKQTPSYLAPSFKTLFENKVPYLIPSRALSLFSPLKLAYFGAGGRTFRPKNSFRHQKNKGRQPHLARHPPKICHNFCLSGLSLGVRHRWVARLKLWTNVGIIVPAIEIHESNDMPRIIFQNHGVGIPDAKASGPLYKNYKRIESCENPSQGALKPILPSGELT